MSTSASVIVDLLERADIRTDGKRAGDIILHDDRFFARVLNNGSIGLGEAYMDQWWEANSLDTFFYKLLLAKVPQKVKKDKVTFLRLLTEYFVNLQVGNGSYKVAQIHYDLGNDLYSTMLDKRMVYTCGYWKTAKTLDEAQEAKLDLICRKLKIKKGMKVLDIGCGFGSFAKYAAEKYGVSVTGVANSKEQISLGRELCKGLPVELIYDDYRNIKGTYDVIASIGMFEHVGAKNFEMYFKVAASRLKNNGLFLLHTIGANSDDQRTDPWLNKYIFPNSELPTITLLGRALERNFVMEDWHNFSTDYDKTLLAWYKNFKDGWPHLRERYDERFYRMWEYYLLVCAGAFRARDNQLWQIVLSKNGVPGGYESVR